MLRWGKSCKSCTQWKRCTKHKLCRIQRGVSLPLYKMNLHEWGKRCILTQEGNAHHEKYAPTNPTFRNIENHWLLLLHKPCVRKEGFENLWEWINKFLLNMSPSKPFDAKRISNGRCCSKFLADHGRTTHSIPNYFCWW